MKNKNIAKFAIPVLLIASLTECTTVIKSTAYAEYIPTTQTIEIPTKILSLIEMAAEEKRFTRSTAFIVETEPWLNPKNKSKTLSNDILISILKEAGFSGESLKYSWAVIMKESMGKVYAHNKNDRTGDDSYGLFQINMRGSLGPARRSDFNLDLDTDLFDPLTNARAAYSISEGGSSWSPWKATNANLIDFYAKEFIALGLDQ